MDRIKNIYCVGRNYIDHVKELQNNIPDEPVIFSKPTHALVKANGASIQLPTNKGDIHYEVELVIIMSKNYAPGNTVDELVEKMALGLDLTLRDVQQELKDQGYPWLLSKGFPQSAIISKFINFPGVAACREQNFALVKNGEIVQEGNIAEMMFDLNTLIQFIGENLGLNKGDIIFTGTPAGVGPLEHGDKLVLKWGEQEVGNCLIEMK